MKMYCLIIITLVLVSCGFSSSEGSFQDDGQVSLPPFMHKEILLYIEQAQQRGGSVVEELNITTLSHHFDEFILLEEANPEWLRTMPVARVKTEHYVVNIFSPIRLFMKQQFDEQERQMFEKRIAAYEEMSSTWSPLTYFYKVENDQLVRCEFYECFYENLLPQPPNPDIPTIKYVPPK